MVNPRLNEKTLQLIVEDTRKLIIELYIGCEHDFLTGLEIFEAIVEKQIIDTSEQQIQLLQTNIDTTLASSDISETIKPTDELEVMQVPENEEPESEPEPVSETETEPETVPSFKSEVENEIIKEDNDKNISLPMTTSEITTSSVFSPATVTTTETTTEFPPATTTVFPPATTTVFPPATSVFPSATETTTSTVFPPASTYATIKQPTIAPIMAPAFPIAPAPIAVGGTRKKKYNKYFKKTRKGMRKY